MAKRKTIQNNPLDSLSDDSRQEPVAGVETLLMGTREDSKGVAAKPSSPGKSRLAKETKRHASASRTTNLVVKKELSGKDQKKEPPRLSARTIREPLVEASRDSLGQRVSRLEEDSRMQTIMMGIILVPLAVLALLGAAPPA